VKKYWWALADDLRNWLADANKIHMFFKSAQELAMPIANELLHCIRVHE
jgi:hypothetical protein